MLFPSGKSFKKQGDAGLGAAIAWFTLAGYVVSLPLTDSQDYDLVADRGEGLHRIQVRTTTHRRGMHYKVNLRVLGGNQSWSGVAKTPADMQYDLLFVVSEDGEMYLLPKAKLGRNSFTLNHDARERYGIGRIADNFLRT
jgi:hypothetical protein